MKQIFRIIGKLFLSLIAFELLIFAGSKSVPLGEWIGSHPGITAALIMFLFLCLPSLLALLKAIRRPNQKEYIVTMTPGAYGRIGNEFIKSKYKSLKRLPGGWFAGVNTYRLDNGSLLFTVCPNLRTNVWNRIGSFFWRLLCFCVIVWLLIFKLPALAYLNAANQTIGTWLTNAGLLYSPDDMSYLDVELVQLPQPSASQTQSESEHPAISLLDEPTSDELPDESQEQDSTDNTDTETDSKGGVVDTVTGWFTGVGDWFSGLFDEDYILPSHRRALTESDIEGMDLTQIQRAINEMYARHGYTFSDSTNVDYFSAQDWYEPVPGKTQEQVSAEFDEIEKENLEFLTTRRSELRS